MLKRNLFIGFCLLSICAGAQEFQAKVSVNAQRVSSTVDKKIFTTLQTQLTNLINNRRWTPDTYQPNERIQCFFLLNIENAGDPDVYKGTLTI